MYVCIAIHTCMQQLMKDEAMNLDESGKGLVGKFGGRKEKGKIVIL